MAEKITPFYLVYDCFLAKITDDMYMELSRYETYELLQDMLLAAIQKFEFPRVNINDYDLSFVVEETEYCGVESDEEVVKATIYKDGCFNNVLSFEEINVLATYMVVEWFGQQLASIENVRMKYSGVDFKMTSQANHMQKVKQLKEEYEREGFHLQRLYKRRKADTNGIMRSTFGSIMEASYENKV